MRLAEQCLELVRVFFFKETSKNFYFSLSNYLHMYRKYLFSLIGLQKNINLATQSL
jgi:hypothetical protein